MARIKRHSTSDYMDEWLDSQGYYRKHTAKDGSCLFRAVAEQVFNSQVFHVDVRMSCISYMDRNRDMFLEFFEGSFDNHLTNLQNSNEYAGQVEMSALSLLLKRDFLVFHEVGKGPFNVTDNGYKNKIILYFSQGNHYDSVYPKAVISDAAMCQSLIYEILYKRVFRMGDEVDLAVEKMLHDKAYAKMRKDSSTSVDSNWCPDPQDGSIPLSDLICDQENDAEDDEAKNPACEIRRALAQGYPPFPYKVAKALDPQIYRNVEFDVWNEAQKDETVFEPGVKCLVRMDKEKLESYHAHIQEISPEKGPVTVYIVELGKKETVPYENLEPLPSYNKGWQARGSKNYKAISSYYQKPHVNGGIMDLDKYKGKKKMYKKGKFKDVSFSVALPCSSQGLPSRLQHPIQGQFETSVLPMGRGRGRIPYQAVPRNPAPHFKWISPVHANNQRYQQRSSGGERYYVPNVGFSPHDNQQRMYEHKSSYDYQQTHHQTREQPAPLMKGCASSAMSATWNKPNSQNTSSTAFQRHGTSSNSQQDVDADRNFVNRGPNEESEMTTNCDIPVDTQTALPTGVISSSTTPPQSVAMSTHTATSACTLGSIPSAAATISSHSPLSSTTQTLPVSTTSSSVPPLMVSSPAHHQQVTLYPWHYYSGVCVPYEAPQLPVNFTALRSQDPGGADLPLQDLPTLRFFFNLGCDYFRMSTIVHVPQAPNQYGMWSCAAPTYGYQPYNGYLTPMSNSGCCEPVDESVSAGCSTGGGTPGDQSSAESTGDGAPLPEDLYESPPTYMYSSPPMNFIPGPVYHQPLDYCSPVASSPLLGDYKGALVVNDQGILSLGGPPLPGAYVAQHDHRHRSDSVGSNLSQCSNNRDWNWPLTNLVAPHPGLHYYGDGAYVEHRSNGGHINHNGGAGANSFATNGTSTPYRNCGGTAATADVNGSGGNGNNGGAGKYGVASNYAAMTGNNDGSGNYTAGVGNNGTSGNYNGGGAGGLNGGSSKNGGSWTYSGANNGSGNCSGGSHRHSASARSGNVANSQVPNVAVPPRFQQHRNTSPSKQHSAHFGSSISQQRQSSVVQVGHGTAAYPLVQSGGPLGTPASVPPGPVGGNHMGVYLGGNSGHPAVLAGPPASTYFQHHPTTVLYPTTTHSPQQMPYFPSSS